MAEQTTQKEKALRVLTMLEGKWMGEGQGDFPTIDSFDYQETLTFERRDETSLFYQQRTEKRSKGKSVYQTSHWESGFLRILDNGIIEWSNSQSGGRTEILVGIPEIDDDLIRMELTSQALTNDERMVSSARMIEVGSGILKYQMGMQTTRVEKLTPHLAATLYRVT